MEQKSLKTANSENLGSENTRSEKLVEKLRKRARESQFQTPFQRYSGEVESGGK